MASLKIQQIALKIQGLQQQKINQIKNQSDNVYIDDRNVKSEDGIGKESAQKKMLAWHSDSCLVTKTAPKICKGNCKTPN